MQKIQISDVTLATELLPEGPALQYLRARSNRRIEHFPTADASWVKPYEEHSMTHPFLLAAQLAFNDHRPMEISPDMIWLMIVQAVGMHVTLYADDLRAHFVSFEGKEKIVVERDEFDLGCKDNDWQGVVTEFSEQVAGRSVAKWRTILNQKFTTTGPAESFAFEVGYLVAMANYFEYECISMCGIPFIHLSGTPDDWRAIITAVKELRALKLDWWVAKILPSLEKILESALGKPDPAFWKSFYKLDDQSGGPYISGWITLFFPYLETKFWNDPADPDLETESLWEKARRAFGFGTKETRKRNGRLIRNPLITKSSSAMVELQFFPDGLSFAPFLWKYMGSDLNMGFMTGFLGVKQQSDTLILRPEIGWAVVESTEG